MIIQNSKVMRLKDGKILYDDLRERIDDLTGQLDIIEQLKTDVIPDTVQTITFDSSGNVSQVIHTHLSTVVRTDTFTFRSATITEVRTLSTGQKLTIVTDTATLATTITYAES